MEKIKQEQDLILDVIESRRECGESSVSRSDIKADIMKTRLSSLDRERFSDGRGTKLDHLIDQALYQLKKKGVLERTARRKWKIIKKRKMPGASYRVTEKGKSLYMPKTCQSLEPEYVYECPKCGHKEKIIGEPMKGVKRCRQCSRVMKKMLFRYHCPVMKTYIGSPTAQCELLHGTDLDKKEKRTDPMRLCYFENKPTEPRIEFARVRVNRYEERVRELTKPKTRGF